MNWKLSDGRDRLYECDLAIDGPSAKRVHQAESQHPFPYREIDMASPKNLV